MNGAVPVRRAKVSAIVACYNELGNIAAIATK